MSEDYVALTKVHLHLFDGENHSSDGGVYKRPGETITADELEESGQGKEEVANLLACGAIVTLEDFQAGNLPVIESEPGDSTAETGESASVVKEDA